MALAPTSVFSFTAKIETKVNRTRIRREPDVPRSNTRPATDLFIWPEKIEEIKAIARKAMRASRNFDLGNSTIPLERIDARNAPIKTTRTVAKNAILAE
jgi:hypothetical protein